MTTVEADKTQTTNGSRMTWSLSSDVEFYFACAVLLIGVVGTAGNALILYALVASKQHKKHVLIVNQNATDLFSSFFLVVTYALKLCNIHLTGALGYWLCMMLLGESLIWFGSNASFVNLAAIAVDRYLRVVHPIWSRKRLRPWMIHSAIAFSWLVGIVYNAALVFKTSAVMNGICYSYVFFDSDASRMATGIFHVLFYYVIILVICIFCYGRILIAIRRQATVMSGHSAAAGPSTAPTHQSNQIHSNVIKMMILVCTFFAVTQLLINAYIAMLAVDRDITFVDARYYVSVFLSFLYTTTNPFIYATKFDPVRQILKGMIRCRKNSTQLTDDRGNAETRRRAVRKVNESNVDEINVKF